MIEDWSKTGHRQVTDWSYTGQAGHRLVTGTVQNWSQTGVTDWWLNLAVLGNREDINFIHPCTYARTRRKLEVSLVRKLEVSLRQVQIFAARQNKIELFRMVVLLHAKFISPMPIVTAMFACSPTWALCASEISCRATNRVRVFVNPKSFAEAKEYGH